MALHKLATEDPSFRVSTDPESGQTIIKGMGELHLDIKVDILKRTHKVEVNVGAPQVAYRETITGAPTVDYTHKKQTGGTGQFARVKIVVEPNEKGQGYEFENKIVGGVVPKEYIPGVEKGLNSVMTRRHHCRLSGRRCEGVADRWRLSRGRFLGHRFRDRRSHRFPRGAAKVGPGSARADHEGRGGDAGGVSRQRHRRPQFAARPDRRHRQPRQRPGRRRPWCRSPTCSATSTTCAR